MFFLLIHLQVYTVKLQLFVGDLFHHGKFNSSWQKYYQSIYHQIQQHLMVHFLVSKTTGSETCCWRLISYGKQVKSKVKRKVYQQKILIGVVGSFWGDVDVWDWSGYVSRNPYDQGQGSLQASVSKNSGKGYIIQMAIFYNVALGSDKWHSKLWPSA